MPIIFGLTSCNKGTQLTDLNQIHLSDTNFSKVIHVDDQYHVTLNELKSAVDDELESQIVSVINQSMTKNSNFGIDDFDFDISNNDVTDFSHDQIVHLFVKGRDISANRKIIPSSKIDVPVDIVAVPNEVQLVDLSSITFSDSPFYSISISAVNDNLTDLLTENANNPSYEYVILNDYGFSLKILKRLKGVVPTCDKNDYSLSIIDHTLITSNDEHAQYELSVKLTANQRSSYFTGSTTIKALVDIEILPIKQVVDISGLQDDVSYSDTVYVNVNDVHQVTNSELLLLNQDSNVKSLVFAKIKEHQPQVIYSDFTISNDATPGDYSSNNFSKSVQMNVSASASSQSLIGSFNFNVTICVIEPKVKATYTGLLNVNLNFTVTIAGHCDTTVNITGVWISFDWSVPRNLINPSSSYSLVELINDGFITQLKVWYNTGSRIDAKMDGAASFAGAKDETSKLDDTNTYKPISSINNYLGYRRNGNYIKSDTTFLDTTPQSLPTDNVPSNWVSSTASPTSNKCDSSYFWNNILIYTDVQCNVSLRISHDLNFRFYVSALDTYSNFNFGNTTNETQFNAKGQND